MTPAPAFLFDLDGTLAATLDDIAASTNHVRARHGLDAADLATVRTFVGDGARVLLRRALAAVMPEPTEAFLDAAFAQYAEHHREQCTVSVRLYPGAREHLDRLHAAGHPLAVVTNKPERFATPIIEHLDLAAMMGAVVGGDTLPQRKPDPAPLRLALERLGASPQGAVMVGDGIQDVRAGKALGLRTIACLYGFHDEATLRAEHADVYWRAFGVEA
ncbi:MAG: HAD-IA family hydrolase [Planctomycetes bacterium]|nr:HAD-IA family hydrolase [Planctomycetota bacterium]